MGRQLGRGHRISGQGRFSASENSKTGAESDRDTLAAVATGRAGQNYGKQSIGKQTVTLVRVHTAARSMRREEHGEKRQQSLTTQEQHDHDVAPPSYTNESVFVQSVIENRYFYNGNVHKTTQTATPT
jgi:hypothetical protein